MKFLKIFLSIIAVLAVIVIGGSFFLPKSYSVNRTITILAPDSIIYKNIADYHEFYKWNAWSKMDPQAKITITGTVAQPGHLYQWNGEKSGTGQMLINKVAVNKMVDMELKFIKPMESVAKNRFDIEKVENGNKVTWTMSGESKGIINKWFCLFMDKMIGKDFEEGLKFLKEKSEKRV
ncbi:SRPBCC family protein [Pedobacter sp. KACC 23697]|uniref:SRPBCC family protein n=1 Tax=Pedobacter sp. KACC 23697 TaxID=3149230 RepID=A0AAU7K6Y0_9SPHI